MARFDEIIAKIPGTLTADQVDAINLIIESAIVVGSLSKAKLEFITGISNTIWGFIEEYAKQSDQELST